MVRQKAAVCGEDRCVMSLKAASKETTPYNDHNRADPYPVTPCVTKVRKAYLQNA